MQLETSEIPFNINYGLRNRTPAFHSLGYMTVHPLHPLHPLCHLRLPPLTRSFILLVCSKLTSAAGRSIICLILAVHRQRANLRLRCNDLTITRFPSENTSWLGSFGELNYLIRLSVRFRDWIGTTRARVLVETRSLFTRDTAPWNYSSRSDQQWENGRRPVEKRGMHIYTERAFPEESNF